ncbi:MAG: hypothetical protein U0X20_32065, partial [Caldilineaceae bacterium]
MPLDPRLLAQHGGRAIAAAAVLAVLVLLVLTRPATAHAAVRALARFSPPSGLPVAPPHAPVPVTAAIPTTGTVVADTGFRPKVDGFSFRNYDGGSNLTAAALQRLFGPGVCAGGQDTPCLLTPAAEQWMGHYNRLMAAGGHCYGFSTLSLLFYAGHARSSGFGAPVTPRLQLEGNQPLQQEIAYAWTFQALPTVRGAGISGSPAKILAALIEGLNAPTAGNPSSDSNSDPGSGPGADSYTLAFTKADGSGGHAVTPYAVEDRGGGQFVVLVYDSNFPGQARTLQIDRDANTWSYNAAANPNRPSGRYTGDAASRSLFLFPTGPALGPQPCPFCAPQDTAGDTPAGATGDDSGDTSDTGPAGPSFNQVFLGGAAPPGTRLVFAATPAGGDRSATPPLRAELPGVKQYPIFTGDLWADSAPPDVYLPAGRTYALAVDAGALTQPAKGDIVLVGQGFTLAARNIQVDPSANPSVFYPAADGSSLAFVAAGEETPTFNLGTTAGGASYALTVAGASLPEGATADLALDGDGALQITFGGTEAPLQYDLALRRIDVEGEALFAHADLTYLPDSVVYVDYGAWEGEGDVELQVDEDGDGTIDATESFSDEPALDPGADSEATPEVDPAACEPGSPCDDTGADLLPDAVPPSVDLDAGEPDTAEPD